MKKRKKLERINSMTNNQIWWMCNIMASLGLTLLVCGTIGMSKFPLQR